MHIEKSYISPFASNLIQNNILAQIAYTEVTNSINNMTSANLNYFIINNSSKNCNGVVPIKEKCYELLEETYHWYREKPLHTLSNKGGPIDVYKEFYNDDIVFHVGLEFETGNISSAHRSMNKLLLGLHNQELQLTFLIMPIMKLSYYLTDRVSNFEELEPYFALLENDAAIVLGFDAEKYSPEAPLLSKGKDGMSQRSIRKWTN